MVITNQILLFLVLNRMLFPVFANGSVLVGILILFQKLTMPLATGPLLPALGDLDGDALPDMVVTNWQNYSFSILRYGIDVPPANIPQIDSIQSIEWPSRNQFDDYG
jgi:hypothetical protein